MGDPNETRAAAHSASTVPPIHDVQPGCPAGMSSRITASGVQPAVGAVADSEFAQICAILHLPRKRDLRLSGQIWGDPHETRAAAHSTSTVPPIHDVHP